MCKDCPMDILEYDEQELFTIFHCKIHDFYCDGYGNSLELSESIKIKELQK